MVPYVGALVAVVCVACVYAERVRWCEVDGNAGVGDGCGVVVVSAGHVGGTRGSGTVECCVLYPCCMGVFGMFAVM